MLNAFDIMDELGGDLAVQNNKLPRLAWNGNINDADPTAPGFFWIEQNELDACPGGWKARRVKVTSGLVDAWAANEIDVNILAWRSRWVCQSPQGVEVYFAQGEQIPPGHTNQRSHIQVIVDIYGDGDAEPIRAVWGMKGVSKTIPFNNTYVGKRSQYSDWPSVMHRLLDWATGASAEIGRKVYPQLAFRVRLGTFSGDDGPVAMKVGRDYVTHRYVYTVLNDTSTPWGDVYIGDDRYRELAIWMRDEGRDWINDKSFTSGSANGDGDGDDDDDSGSSKNVPF